MDKYKADCSCGSGKPYGLCHGKDEPCPCGSGKKVSECCMANPDAPEHQES
jgi:uncharacterized protein YchJ